MYNQYDLSHNLMTIGKLGRLLTLGSPIPVIAGDRIKASFNGLWRLSPLRRHFAVDVRVDCFAFYIPYRFMMAHSATLDNTFLAPSSGNQQLSQTADIPVSEWARFIEAGPDGTGRWRTDLTASQMQGPFADRYSAGVPPAYLGVYADSGGGTYPRVLDRGYTMIYNHFFRDPTNQAPLPSFISQNAEGLAFGARCSNIKSMWTTPVADDLQDEDYQVNIVSNALDLRDLAMEKAEFGMEQSRNWRSQRYRDLVKAEYKGHADADADFRPRMLAHSHFALSGYEVNGTETDNLGQSVGKSVGRGGFSYPRKYFPEHGLIFHLALLRYPPIFKNQAHRLFVDDSLDYGAITGDPDMIANTPPETLKVQDLFYSTNNAEVGKFPAGQHYRCHPHQVHPGLFSGDDFGFPVIDVPADTAGMYLCPVDDWERAFSSTALGHWQFFGYFNIDALRVLPPAGSSIFSGA